MKKASVIAMTLLAASVVFAQDFGTAADVAVAELGPEVGQGASVEAVNTAAEEAVGEGELSARERIDEYFDSKEDWIQGYDEENDRILIKEFIEFDIRNPEVSTDFLDLRVEKISELTLNAKAKVIETIMSKMSAERVLSVPGNPIAKQLEKEMKEIDKQIEVSRKQVLAMDAKLAEAAKSRSSVSTFEWMRFIAKWFNKAEADNYVAQLDADKQERYKNAKADFDAAMQNYETVKEKAEVLKGTISKEMKTSISKVAEMPIYGCTILQQAESIKETNGRYKYEMALIMCWSMEMQEAAGAILKGEEMKFTPGKRSVKEWLRKKADIGALAQWVGPRQFIDNKGNMWFIGISCAPVSDDADEAEEARGIAELEADMQARFSLYADVSSAKTANKLTRTVRGADGEATTKVYKDYSKNLREAIQDINLSGMAQLGSYRVEHAPSGLPLEVVVYGINSGSPKALKEIQTKAVALGIEVNTDQEFERGRQAQQKKTFEESKNNPAARAAGAAAAKQDVQEEAKKRAERRAARKRAAGSTFSESKGKSSSSAGSAKGKLRKGSAMVIDEDDE